VLVAHGWNVDYSVSPGSDVSTASAWKAIVMGLVGRAVGFSGNGCAVFLSVGCLRTA
jgi:hypothetical protein